MRCGVGQGGAGGPIKPLFGAFSNPLEAKSFCLQLPCTGTGSQCEAGVRAPLQLGAQPHTLQSSEQVCLRVRGWAGHGSCAVGWGRVVPSNPFSVPSAILWKPSHFVCNCPSRAPGLSVRLVFVWNGHCALSHTHCSSVINSVSGCGAGRATGHALWGGAGGSIKPLFGAFSNLWKPSHFVSNCPSRVPGLSVRLV
jgi:hypothetical protein